MKNNLLKKVLKSTAAKLIAAFLMSGAVQESQAVVFLWNNTGTNWTSPTSWTNGVQPSSTSSSTTTDEIQFGNFGANNNTVVLTSTRAARNITFLTNANPYLINSFNGTQTLSSSGGITNNSTATQTFNILVENANNSNTWFQATGGTLVFNNVASLTTASSSTSRTLTLAGDGAFTFNNELKQGGLSTAGIVKHIGAGTVTMNGTNTLAGGFEITGGGTVIVNGSTGVGQGVVTMSNGNSKLIINTTTGLSTLNSFKGSSSLANMSTLDLLAGNDSSAVTTFVVNQFQGNNMSFTNHGAGKTLLQFTNAANTLTASASTSGGRRLINNSANLTIQFDGTLDIGSTVADVNTLGGAGDFLFKGSLLNTASVLRGLNKTGTGTVTFQAVNSYNGDTTIQEGTLVIDTAGSIASSAAIISGGTLRVKGIAGTSTVNSGSLLVNSGGLIGNTTVGGGTLLVDGTAGNVIVNSGTATVNSGGSIGSTTINASLLTMNGSAGDVVVNTGGTLGGSGSVQGLTLNGGIVAPGNSPGLLSAYELNGSNGTFQFQLGAPTTRGITYDAINVTSLLTLGANTTFTFETLDNYTYADGNTYDLFDWGSADMSSFDVAVLEAALPNLNTPSTDLKWNVSNFTMDGTVGVIPEPSAGSLMAFAVASLITLKVIRRKKCQRQTHS